MNNRDSTMLTHNLMDILSDTYNVSINFGVVIAVQEVNAFLKRCRHQDHLQSLIQLHAVVTPENEEAMASDIDVLLQVECSSLVSTTQAKYTTEDMDPEEAKEAMLRELEMICVILLLMFCVLKAGIPFFTSTWPWKDDDGMPLSFDNPCMGFCRWWYMRATHYALDYVLKRIREERGN